MAEFAASAITALTATAAIVGSAGAYRQQERVYQHWSSEEESPWKPRQRPPFSNSRSRHTYGYYGQPLYHPPSLHEHYIHHVECPGSQCHYRAFVGPPILNQYYYTTNHTKSSPTPSNGTTNPGAPSDKPTSGICASSRTSTRPNPPKRPTKSPPKPSAYTHTTSHAYAPSSRSTAGTTAVSSGKTTCAGRRPSARTRRNCSCGRGWGVRAWETEMGLG